MSRKPIRDSNWPQRRVVSTHNGKWLPQAYKERDVNARRDRVDPWVSMTGPLSLEDARAVAFSARTLEQKVPE